jgi:hypothetical protein
VSRGLLVFVAFAGCVVLNLPLHAQESALPVDPNSQEVRDAQKQCTAEMKVKLLKEGVRKTAFGAEEEAFQRCKKITGWQSPPSPPAQ